MFKFKTKAKQRNVAMGLKPNSSTTADGLTSSHTCSNTLVGRSTFMTKHYVQFYYPGSFFSETSTKEIANRKEKLEIPNNCYGYSFFDRVEVFQDGELLKGEAKNKSATTFIGKKYTVEELKKEFPKEKILISNIESNGYPFAVKTRMGNWRGVDKKDSVIEMD